MRRSTTWWLALLWTPAVLVAFERAGRADPITYSSWGNIGTGASGVPPIGNFQILPTAGLLENPGTLALGTIEATALPDGASLTYTNMPFYIEVTFRPQGLSPWEGGSDLSLRGVLNGTATGSDHSEVLATLTSIRSTGTNPLPFALSDFSFTPQTLAPVGMNHGLTQLTALLSGGSPPPPTVPEPTPLALMAILVVGAGVRSGLHRIRPSGR